MQSPLKMLVMVVQRSHPIAPSVVGLGQLGSSRKRVCGGVCVCGGGGGGGSSNTYVLTIVGMLWVACRR